MDLKTKKIYFDFYELNYETAWLLGFISADATIGVHIKTKVIRLYSINKELLERIKEYYEIPYKVTRQHTKSNLYFIRFSDPNLVKSVESYGLKKDKSELVIPEMDDGCTISFIKGFMQGKGSYFKEQNSKTYGFKIVFRSKSFIQDLAKYISFFCDVKEANPFCHKIKNEVSCEIKYVGKECDKIKNFLNHDEFISELMAKEYILPI